MVSMCQVKGGRLLFGPQGGERAWQAYRMSKRLQGQCGTSKHKDS